ncbi:nuclear transport factor 2 family protein [Bauldia sp.]|uniref:nuclear transport factor 2 family protein n=1 Tax=Bauldia sp. TaxID=2575872 RepID=UPI003BA99595
MSASKGAVPGLIAAALPVKLAAIELQGVRKEMKTLLVPFVVVSCGLGVAVPAAYADEAADSQAIVESLERLKAGFRDQDATVVREVMTPDAVFVTPLYGAPFTVNQVVRTLIDLEITDDETHSPNVTFMNDDTAFLTFRTSFDGTYSGERPSWSWVFTSSLWKRDGDEWRVSFLQETPIDAPD